MAGKGNVTSLGISTNTAVIKKTASATTPTQPKVDFATAVKELNKDHQAAYDNYKNDLQTGRWEMDECTRIAGYKVNPFCEDKAIFHPENLTYTGVNKHLGLKSGELGRLGFLIGEPGNPDKIQPGYPMSFPKSYIDKVMTEHKQIAGIQD